MGCDDTPLVRAYLDCFAEIVQLAVTDGAVPDSLWARLRDGWAAMTRSERATVERRTRRLP